MATPNYPPPLGTAVPDPTGDLVPPQSPSGSLNPSQDPQGGTNTQEFLTGKFSDSTQQGIAVQTSAPVIAGVDPKAIAWNNTTPGNGTVGNKFS